MKALSYLLLTTLKNRIISMKKKPAMLILYLIILFFILFGIIMTTIADNNGATFKTQDVRIIYMAIAGFGLLFLYTYVTTGLSTGSTLFAMSDVGLLFVAPITPKKILFYGLSKELGKTLLTSIFILYQIGNLKVNFGFGIYEIIALFIIYAIMLFFCQLLSIAIYIFSNGNPARKKLMTTILYMIFAAIILSVLLIQRMNQVGIFEAILRTVNQPLFGYIPLAGWTSMFFKAAVERNVLYMVISIGLYLVFSIMIVLFLTYGRTDYYEDVLLSTEFRHQTLMAAKEGKRVVQRKKKIKIKDSDLEYMKGRGAVTLFHKHILEMRRSSKFVFIDGYTIFATLGAGIASYNIDKEYGIYIILGVLIYLQFFMTMLGRLGHELLQHYIFMIPQSSRKKVFYASVTSLVKPCVDGLFIAGALAVTGGANLFASLVYGLMYAASGAVFVGLTILYQRVLGGQPSKLVQMIVGFGLFFAVMIPAISIAVVVSIMLPENIRYLGTLPFTLFCVLVTGVLFLLCGNLIDKAEFTGK